MTPSQSTEQTRLRYELVKGKTDARYRGVGHMRPWCLIPDGTPLEIMRAWLLGETCPEDGKRCRLALETDPEFRAAYSKELQRRISVVEVDYVNPRWAPDMFHSAETSTSPLWAHMMPHLGESGQQMQVFRSGNGFLFQVSGYTKQFWDADPVPGVYVWADPVLGDMSITFRVTKDLLTDVRHAVWSLDLITEPYGEDGTRIPLSETRQKEVIAAVIEELRSEKMLQRLTEATERRVTVLTGSEGTMTSHEMQEWATVALALRLKLQQIADVQDIDGKESVDFLNQLGGVDDHLQDIASAMRWVSDCAWREHTMWMRLDEKAWWGGSHRVT